MKSEKKAKLLDKLSHWVESTSPQDIKTHMDKSDKMPEQDECDEDEIVPENYHYFNSESQNPDMQDDSEEAKKKRFLKYRSAPIL